MLKVKVPAIGNSMGILLPKEALAKLKSEKGDTLCLIESPEGYTITPYQQDFAPKVHQNHQLFLAILRIFLVFLRRLQT